MTTIYASPSDNLASKISQLTAGDTLVLRDGTYNQSLDVTVSGKQGNPITIKAEHDGQAIVDGQNNLVPLRIYNQYYINIEGIVCKNSNEDVVKLIQSSYINLRRISIYNAGYGNYHTLLIYQNSAYNLIEDSIISQRVGGNGRHAILLITGVNHNIIRRNFVKYYCHYGGGGPLSPINLYGADHNIIENNIFDVSEMCTTNTPYGIRSHSSYAIADDNKFLGNILFGATINPFVQWAMLHTVADYPMNKSTNINNVFINTGYGVRIDGITNTIFDHNTIVNITNGYLFGAAASMIGTATNNSLLNAPGGIYVDNSSLTHTYNNLYNITTPYYGTVSGAGEKTLNPNYNTTKYGKGAYLMIPTALKGKGENGANIGAEVLYQYNNGVLTSIPLFPWAMEDRIFRETGISVTWEANGGLWKTLDGVYDGTSSCPELQNTLTIMKI